MQHTIVRDRSQIPVYGLTGQGPGRRWVRDFAEKILEIKRIPCEGTHL